MMMMRCRYDLTDILRFARTWKLEKEAPEAIYQRYVNQKVCVWGEGGGRGLRPRTLDIDASMPWQP
jgi:hypothetical protein